MKSMLKTAMLLAVLWTVGIFLVIAFCITYGNAQDIPANVKQAMQESLRASNAPTVDDVQGGHHEEGGIWGITTDGNPVIIPAKPGVRCTSICELETGNAKDPSLTANLATITGEYHVHPSATTATDYYVQPPSAADLAGAFDSINIVLGAADHKVYFYDSKGVTKVVKFKDFFKGEN